MATKIQPEIYSYGKIQSSVLASLLYFDLFKYPLYFQEIVQYNNIPGVSEKELNNVLDDLISKKVVFNMEGLYSLTDDRALVKRRLDGNKRAMIYLNRARKITRLIARFPYVRGVLLSGSLSKGYMDKESDVDYFIITEQGRLWFCRTLLAVFRKLMFGSLKKYFCINYFIDASSLPIPDQNIFTATEIAFILPTYNYSLYHKMIVSNAWYKSYFPNKELAFDNTIGTTSKFWLKKGIEKLFNGNLGTRVDTFLFKVMLKRWKKRYKDFDETQFDLNIRTKKSVSKQHEKGHQFLILQKYHERIVQFETQHKIKIQNG